MPKEPECPKGMEEAQQDSGGVVPSHSGASAAAGAGPIAAGTETAELQLYATHVAMANHPLHFLVQEQAKSVVALQELQAEVGSLLLFKQVVLAAFPHLELPPTSSAPLPSATPIASSASSSAPPSTWTRRRHLAQQYKSFHYSSENSTASVLSETRTPHLNPIVDSGFSTEAKDPSSSSSSPRSSRFLGHSSDVADPLYARLAPLFPLPSEKELRHQLDRIKHRMARLRKDEERLVVLLGNNSNQSPFRSPVEALESPDELETLLDIIQAKGEVMKQELDRLHQPTMGFLKTEAERRRRLLPRPKMADVEDDDYAGLSSSAEEADHGENEALRGATSGVAAFDLPLPQSSSQRQKSPRRRRKSRGGSGGSKVHEENEDITPLASSNNVVTVNHVIPTPITDRNHAGGHVTVTPINAADDPDVKDGMGQLVATKKKVSFQDQDAGLVMVTPASDTPNETLPDGANTRPGVTMDRETVASVLQEKNYLVLQKRLLLSLWENKVLRYEMERFKAESAKAVIPHPETNHWEEQLSNAKEDNEDLRFQLEEQKIELEGTKARLRILQKAFPPKPAASVGCQTFVTHLNPTEQRSVQTEQPYPYQSPTLRWRFGSSDRVSSVAIQTDPHSYPITLSYKSNDHSPKNGIKRPESDASLDAASMSSDKLHDPKSRIPVKSPSTPATSASSSYGKLSSLKRELPSLPKHSLSGHGSNTNSNTKDSLSQTKVKDNNLLNKKDSTPAKLTPASKPHRTASSKVSSLVSKVEAAKRPPLNNSGNQINHNQVNAKVVPMTAPPTTATDSHSCPFEDSLRPYYDSLTDTWDERPKARIVATTLKTEALLTQRLLYNDSLERSLPSMSVSPQGKQDFTKTQ